MYIPKSNVLSDKEEAVAFMKRFSFGTIVTSKDNVPTATHLPFLVEMADDKIVITSHFAKANEQWKDIESCKVLVIFSEPHAYISPSNYEKEQNVPTWNYISVHAYGNGRLITNAEKVLELLEKTIDNYEEAYKKQWDALSDDYKINMSKGIVAFEVEVMDLQAKKKLSQNKTVTEQRNIIQSLSKSKHATEQQIAEYMAKELE
jgi:transcriptional regulator